jgi:uncharacterized protein YndB with AHSA1/START domain
LTSRDHCEEPVAEREVVITRVFDAPARLLFAAYSTREHLMKWFGPKDWPLTLCEVDFRVGGRYRFAMTGPSGKQGTPFGGEFVEIVPDRKIVYDDGFELPGAERMVITVTFDEHDGKTKLTVHTLFSSVAMKRKHLGASYLDGWGSSLGNLANVVAEMRGTGSS